MTEFVLVRHGETEANARGAYQGQSDSPLTAAGEAQAMALRPRIAALGCAALYCSDLGRAHRTATLAAPDRLSPIVERDLRERSWGAFEGRTRAEIEHRYPAAWAAWRAGDPRFSPPGGETQADLLDRVLGALRRIADRHPDDRVAAVTHGGVLVALCRHVLAMGPGAPGRLRVPNASINVFRLSGAGWWDVRTLGDTAHLPADPA